MASLLCARRTALSASQASQLPQVLRCSLKPEAAASLCGSGLARDGIAAVRQADRVVCIAGKPAPTVFAVLTKSGGLPRPSVGAGLLAMASLQCARRTALSASQASQLPQFFAVLTKSGGLPRPSVGAGLLAMASLRCVRRTAPLTSQASQLPQVLQPGFDNPSVQLFPVGHAQHPGGVEAAQVAA